MKDSLRFALAVVPVALLLLGGGLWLLTPYTLPADPVVHSAGSASSVMLDTIEPIQPLPPLANLSPQRVALGERLFRDKRFSADQTLACVSCHDLQHGGVDSRPVSIGIGGAAGSINAPTVFNSGLSFAQFWDGRAATLEDQVAGPIHNPVELGSNWKEIQERLSQDPEIVATFKRTYSDGLTINNIADAIATFERSLVTRNSRFDRYLQGDKAALTDREIEGYRLFRELGCSSCHQGALLGGNMFQKFGVLGDYFAGRRQTNADLGRFNVSGRVEDKHVFKVPSLRNITLTAPYFHDGSVKELEKAVVIMGRYQLGRELEQSDVEAIVAFLNSLTGEWQGVPLK